MSPLLFFPGGGMRAKKYSPPSFSASPPPSSQAREQNLVFEARLSLLYHKGISRGEDALGRRAVVFFLPPSAGDW